MRIRLTPLYGKYKVLADTWVKPDNFYVDDSMNKLRSPLNPKELKLPAGTVFTISKVHESVHHKTLTIKFPKTHNEKDNPWAGHEISRFNDFTDFDVEVEKLP
jgi:hypothetical protein